MVRLLGARSGDRKAARAVKAAAGRSIGPVLRLFGVAAIGCAAAGAVILMYPGADESRAAASLRSDPAKQAAAPQNQVEPIQAALAPAPATQPAAAPPVQTTGATAAPPAQRQAAVPQSAPVAQATPVPAPAALVPPPPPALPGPVAAYAPPAEPAPPAAAIPAPPAPSVPAAPAKAAGATPAARFAGASTECLSPDLVTVLNEVQARFGQVTVVSGKEVHTRNHSPGSARHKLHRDCKAVDFTVAGKANEVVAFLKARPEVNGVNSYRPNNLIHIDLNDRRRMAQSRR